MPKHSCPFCFKEYECDSASPKKAFRTYVEERPKDEDVMSGEDFKRMREALKAQS